MRAREDYENSINSASVFDLDKSKNEALYKAAHYFLMCELTDYYRFYIYPNRPLEDYSMTLVETAVECIKYYEKAKGDFLHLFNSVMRRNLGVAKAKERIEQQRSGIKLSDREAMLIRKIICYADSRNIDIAERGAQEKIAVVLGLSVEKVMELIHINYNAMAVSSTVVNDDDGEMELYDLIVDGHSVEDEALSESALRDAVDKIEKVFCAIQERQKKIVSMLLTAEIVRAFDGDVQRAEQLLHGRSLYCSEIVDLCRSSDIPSARRIGEICGVSEQSVSRTYGNFKAKLRLNGKLN